MKLGKPPIRFWIAVMIFFTTYTNYSLRVNMSISIIGMVQKKGTKLIPECKRNSLGNASSTTESNVANNTETNVNEKKSGEKKYDWSENIQGTLLGAYFYGYVLSSMPGGLVAEWIGPFKTIFFAQLIAAIANSLAVFVMTFLNHWSVFFVARFIIGAMGGVVYPGLQCLISKWAPPKEKGKFIGALMGNTLGTCITFPLVGYITERFGWGWGFHVVTVKVLVYCVVFWFLIADSPADHSWVSEEEREFISSSQKGTVSTKKKIPPYFDIFTSVPFWGLTVAQFGNLWGLYLQVTGAPKFVAEVLGFNLKSSGGLAALPFLSRLICGFVFGSIAHILPALSLVLITFVGCNWMAAVALLAISQGLNGAATCTTLQNPQDLSPNFAATIFGIISLIGGITGFITPAVTGLLIKKNNGVKEWQMNFMIGAIVYSFCGIFFVIFGSGKTQPWNNKEAEPQPESV